MRKSDFFETELQLIENEDLREFVREIFDDIVPAYFWEIGASASGKYHPEFTKGEGGLVRHTKAVAQICEELLRMNTYAYMRDEYKDFARVACLLHDTAKYGREDEPDKEAYKEHGKLAAEMVENAFYYRGKKFDNHAPELLVMAIRAHMGQWTPEREDRPFTNIDRLVHLADYIASRPMFDCPAIIADYNRVKGE